MVDHPSISVNTMQNETKMKTSISHKHAYHRKKPSNMKQTLTAHPRKSRRTLTDAVQGYGTAADVDTLDTGATVKTHNILAWIVRRCFTVVTSKERRTAAAIIVDGITGSVASHSTLRRNTRTAELTWTCRAWCYEEETMDEQITRK